MNLSELTSKLSRKQKKESDKLAQIEKLHQASGNDAQSNNEQPKTKTTFIAVVYYHARSYSIIVPKDAALNESLNNKDLAVISIRKATEQDLL